MAGDPLGLVYTGQDNSGAAAILNNGTINPTQVLLDLQKEERLRKLREATVKAQLAAKAAKPENLGAIPNFSPAPYHSAYFTQVASDLVKQRRPYDEGAIPQEQRPQFMQDYQIQKAGAMLLGVKSAKLWENAKPQVEAYNKAPWRYPQGTNEVIKKWMEEPPDTQMPLQLQQLNESDYVKAIQEVDVGYPTRKVEVKNADGTSTVTDQNYFDEKNVRTKYDAWKSNKNDPRVKAFYDHAEELFNAHPEYKQLKPEEQAAKLDAIGYKFFREQKKAEFDQKYALGLQGAPKGDKSGAAKQKTLSEMKNIEYNTSYNTAPKTTKGVAKDITSYTIVHPKKAVTNIRLSGEIYDTDTKNPVTDVNTVTFVPGQIIVANKQTKSGQLVKMPWVSGYYEITEKNKQTGYNEKVRKNILVPLEQMEGTLDAAGEQYKWAYELADQLNMESISPKKDGKKSSSYDYSKIKF